ncbi:MAG: hypothetical protein ACRD8K_07715 [Nitrososphaeraceae archaeon]
MPTKNRLNPLKANFNDPFIILTMIKNLLQKSMTELIKGNYTGASELVDIAYIDNNEHTEDPSRELDKI